MRRLSKACTNESHPLYGAFMSSLSTAIFEWDPEDVALLKKAKEGELRNAGLSNPSSAAVTKAINKNEMARHCKRRTRGAADTVNLLDAIFSSASELTDTLGTFLLCSAHHLERFGIFIAFGGFGTGRRCKRVSTNAC